MKQSVDFISKKPLIVLMLLLAIGYLWASSNGVTGKTTLGNSPGCTCHSAQPSDNVTVTISGPDTVQPNAVATFQVQISGGTLSAAGINIAADRGQLEADDAFLQKLNEELTHSSPKSPFNNVVTFQFTYTAPETEGPVVIAATGNSVNLNGSTSGDVWNHAPSFTVQVKLPSALNDDSGLQPEDYLLEQNYPNPFNASTTIQFYLPKTTFVRLTVLNAAGEKVKILTESILSAGKHSLNFKADALPSGMYFYRLQTAERILTRKMLLLK
ncbi:choice-of-anchor V domain-containing protein [Calditrichota bacterium GD2]